MPFFLPATRLVFSQLLLLLMLLLAGPGCGWAQAPTFTQAVSLNPSGGNGRSEGRAVATDAAGNQYVTGNFTGTLVLGGSTLVSAGDRSMFVAKRSGTTGAWLWAAGAASNDGAGGYGIAVDASGHAVVTGYFNRSATFNTSPAPTILTAAGGTNMFLAKFDATTGTCAWAVQTGGSAAVGGNAVAVDANGDILVTGSFYGTATFSAAPFPITLVSASTGSTAMFVAKFETTTGTCTWAVRAGGNRNVVGYGMAVDAGGNVLVTGYFLGTATFDTGQNPLVLVAAGAIPGTVSDMFVAKFGAATGACAWAVRAGAGADDHGYSVAVDASGNAVVTGSFASTVSFDTSPAPTILVAARTYNAFVAKFEAATGRCVWAVQAGGDGVVYGYGVAVDASGNALVTGSFAGTATFNTSPAPTILVSGGMIPGTRANVFVAKFGAATGACAWIMSAGGNGDDEGRAVALDAGGNAFVTGSFQAAASFGNFSLMGSSNRMEDTGFLAVLGGAGTLPTRAPALAPIFMLAPNPARSTCQVQGAAAGAAVTVLDALGRSLTQSRADASGTAWLDLPAGLAPGLYLVRSGGQVRRLVVE